MTTVDGSRRVSYLELALLVRQQLKLSRADLPEARLHALWKVLDENGSGFVDPGELGRFMRIGRPERGVGAREKLLLAKRSASRKQITERERRSGKLLTAQLSDSNVPPATDDEVRELSQQFNAAMARRAKDVGSDNFYRLFKHMDIDGSGRISYVELQRMVREELKLSRTALPKEKLQSLWCALDENASGFICAGEFGRFINKRGVVPMLPPDPVTQARERQREDHIAERNRKAAQWKATAAKRASDHANSVAAEAAALESALKLALAGGGGGAGALEALKQKLESSSKALPGQALRPLRSVAGAAG
jgi:Ca2+-binding EF-hand superfamily protein